MKNSIAVRRILAGLTMLVLLAVFYANRCTSTGVNPGEDVVEHDLPLGQWYVRSMEQGSFPLWNFHKAYGIPACETPLMGPYYPGFAAYFLLPLGWAVNLYAMTGNATLTCYYHTAGDSGLPADLCSLLNIKYVVEEITDSGQLERYRQGGFDVVRTMEADDGPAAKRFALLRNQKCFPRAFLIEGASRAEIAAIMPATAGTDSSASPTPVAPAQLWQTLSGYRTVSIERAADTYRIDYVSEQDGLVCLSEMHDSGWKVNIDGVPAEVHRALEHFLGVQVPAGVHRVVFAYRPRPIYLFWTISFLTLVASLGAAVATWRRLAASAPTEAPLVKKEALR
ncbi:MAG: YfhO family protein [Planctomycetaceae bacterium]|nr:YfhO family protein [Planctomycetaceae bacterium]